jgi:dipeptidase
MKPKGILWLVSIAVLFSIGILIPAGIGAKANKIKAPWPDEIDNCTSIPVSKAASADGSVMTSHACDGGYEFRLHVVLSRTHQPGEMRTVLKGGGNGAEQKQAVKGGEIPEVKETFSRFDIAYPFMNEKQVAMGETTFGGRQELYNPEGFFDIMELERVALERASTAREAIKIMGELATKYGYSDYGECLTVCDTKEAWVFEIMGPGPLQIGALWAARRVPDGEVSVSANRSRIGEIDSNDKENFMASENVFKLGEEMGWYNPKAGKPFKFNEAYAPDDSIGCRRREWRVLSTLAPSLKLDPWALEYPWSVKPDKKVIPQMIMALHRDYYQGTEFDLSKGLAAGPFANPIRFSTSVHPPEGYLGWERPISIFRCSYCFVSQSRAWLPDWVGGLIWFAEDDPKTSCFVPLYCSITTVPESLQIGRRDVFDRKSAWWAFDFVSNWANLRFSSMIEDIRRAYQDFETTFFNLQPAVEARAKTLYQDNPQACREYLTRYSNEMAQRVVDDWWTMADYLIVKYNDGYISTPGKMPSAGYPKEWLDAVGYGKTKIINKK